MPAPPQDMTTGNTTTKTTSSSEDSYTVKGSVRYPDGKPVTGGIKIQVMDSDQEVFQDHNDDLIAIVPVNDLDGTFEASFDPKLFKDGWLEGHPDIYLMVRNALDGHVVYKTEIRKGVKQNSSDLIFDITINSIEEEYVVDILGSSGSNTLYDAFQSNNERVIAAFMRLGDVMQFVPGDINRNFALLVSSINAWTFYTREDMWRKIKYDGPQVPRYPWRERHSHKLSWEEMM
jgi:hypothetical protein